MQVIDILLIDDDKQFCRSLRNRFLLIGEETEVNFQVRDYQNLDEGFAELEKDSKYKALILDAKALITSEQDNPNLNFLPVALHRLEKLNQKTGRIHTPFAVITGYYDNFLSFDTLIKEQKGKLFDKSSQEEEMLQYLLKEIESAENTKIEKQYENVFDIFRDDKKYLDSSCRTDLLFIIKKMNDESDIKNNFTQLRKILEEIYKKLRIKGEIPDALFHSDGRPNLEWVYYYLQGHTRYPNPGLTNLNPVREKHLLSCIDYLKNITSIITHAYSSNVTIYAYKSAVFTLLEVLLWFKAIMGKP